MTRDPSRPSLLILTQKVSEDDFDLWFFVSWINAFARYFQTVKVICLEEGHHPNLSPNVEIATLGKERRNLRIARLCNLYRHLFRFLPQVDGVFVHMNQIYVFLGWPLYALFRKKRALWYNHRITNWDVKLAVHLVDAILTASDESFPLKTRKKVITGHGIDTDFYRPQEIRRDDSSFRLLSLGRITPTKNQLIMCEALHVLRKRGYNNVLLDVYSQPATESDWIYYNQIKEYVLEHDLSNHVFVRGRAENRDMPTVYNSHDLFLNLATRSGIDKVVLEAMACGVNVLTSNATFEPLLPEENYLRHLSPESVAEGVIGFLNTRRKNLELREIVVRRNNLDDLIRKFYDVFAR